MFQSYCGTPTLASPNAKNFELEAYRERFQAGDAVWTYANTLWLVDTPPLGPRALGWSSPPGLRYAQVPYSAA